MARRRQKKIKNIKAISYDEICEKIAKEAEFLSTEELKSKITSWLLNEELSIYAHVLQQEYSKRSDT